MSDILTDILNALTAVAAVCGLMLIAGIVVSLVCALFRVVVLGRVLVLPFRDSDPARAPLTALFVERLMAIETAWVSGAHAIESLLKDFTQRSRDLAGNAAARRLQPAQATPSSAHAAPLVDGGAIDLDAYRPTAAAENVGASPRSIGDEHIDHVLVLEDRGSLAGADVGVVSFAGVSFSPGNLVAALRRLLSVAARRVISGAILSLGDEVIVTVCYRERSRRGTRRATSIRHIDASRWLSSIDELAFEFAKERIHTLRTNGAHGTQGASAPAAQSEVDRILVEAESWPACEAFIAAYSAQIRHYLSGCARDRERALERYEQAISAQPGYCRAAYNRAVLLYNRYRRDANDEAITCFTAATQSQDERDRALAFAGLTMAYAQVVHRFDPGRSEVVALAAHAGDEAIRLEPELEEALLAQAWVLQIKGDWDDAIAAYGKVGCGDLSAPPARRMASFARNNAGWILLNALGEHPGALPRAERCLWEAVALYPNKIAYANLAEVARRCARYDEALGLFGVALGLDPEYVSGWHERARLELEIADHAADAGDAARRREYLDLATKHQARAVRLAADDAVIAQLSRGFAERARVGTDGSKMLPPAA